MYKITQRRCKWEIPDGNWFTCRSRLHSSWYGQSDRRRHKMKYKSRVLLVFLAATAMTVLLAMPAGATATRTEVTGTEITKDISDFGTWTYLPSGRIRVRGMVLENWDDTNDSRTTGTNIVISNMNWDANHSGPFWGTFHLESDDLDGYWDGTFTGYMPADGSCAEITSVGFGGGDFEGLQYRLNLVGCGASSTIEGEILDPHGE
jgi:hypothetical protein